MSLSQYFFAILRQKIVNVNKLHRPILMGPVVESTVVTVSLYVNPAVKSRCTNCYVIAKVASKCHWNIEVKYRQEGRD